VPGCTEETEPIIMGPGKSESSHPSPREVQEKKNLLKRRKKEKKKTSKSLIGDGIKKKSIKSYRGHRFRGALVS